MSTFTHQANSPAANVQGGLREEGQEDFTHLRIEPQACDRCERSVPNQVLIRATACPPTWIFRRRGPLHGIVLGHATGTASDQRLRAADRIWSIKYAITPIRKTMFTLRAKGGAPAGQTCPSRTMRLSIKRTTRRGRRIMLWLITQVYPPDRKLRSSTDHRQRTFRRDPLEHHSGVTTTNATVPHRSLQDGPHLSR